MKARDLDEAFEIANSTEFALTAGFFAQSGQHRARQSGDRRRQRLHQSLMHRRGRRPSSFGGFKMSGGGTKAGGADYLLQFVVPRVVTENITRHGFAPEQHRSTEDEFLPAALSRIYRSGGRPCKAIALRSRYIDELAKPRRRG